MSEMSSMSLQRSGVPGLPLGATKNPMESSREKAKAPAVMFQCMGSAADLYSVCSLICCSRLTRSPRRRSSSPF